MKWKKKFWRSLEFKNEKEEFTKVEEMNHSGLSRKSTTSLYRNGVCVNGSKTGKQCCGKLASLLRSFRQVEKSVLKRSDDEA